MKNKNIPESIAKLRPKGTTIVKIDNIYYLYRVKSKRVAGLSYPLVERTYIGTIDENGIHEGRTKVGSEEIEVFEYGFTKFIEQACQKTKRRIANIYPDTYEAIFRDFILKLSPNSYLRESKRENYDISEASRNNYFRDLEKEILAFGVEIECLKHVYLLKTKERSLLAKISAEQAGIIKKLGIKL